MDIAVMYNTCSENHLVDLFLLEPHLNFTCMPNNAKIYKILSCSCLLYILGFPFFSYIQFYDLYCRVIEEFFFF